MAEIRYKIGHNAEGTEVFLEIEPILKGEKVVYSIRRESPEERSVKFFTGTTDMKDWIGNVREITICDERNDVFLEVEGIYRGKKQTVRNIKRRDPHIIKLGERVMVTEHLNVAGGFDMLASKARLLDLTKPELNFINIGWTTNEACRYLRVDPYTGEVKDMVGSAVP